MKHTAKKSLSILLALVMLLSSMSVGFTVFAAGSASDAQWNTLINALKNDTVKEAVFTGDMNNYEVSDPDGKVFAAVEAYWDVFKTYSAFGLGNNQQNNQNRTINQVNSAIISQLQAKMGTDFDTYKTESFIRSLISGASISADSKAASWGSNTLSDAPTVKLTVERNTVLLSYPE